jgi:hypothetical protein
LNPPKLLALWVPVKVTYPLVEIHLLIMLYHFSCYFRDITSFKLVWVCRLWADQSS